MNSSGKGESARKPLRSPARKSERKPLRSPARKSAQKYARSLAGKPVVSVLAGVLLMTAALLLSLCLGAARLSLSDTLRGLSAGSASPEGRILYFVRLPRALAAAIAGAGLASAGVIIQAVLANPLAGPGVIGVNAGAGFGVALCGAFLPITAAVWLSPAAAFAGALCAVLLVYGISSRAGASRMTLLLSGVAISSLMTAGINTVTTLVPDALGGMNAFHVGGFSGISADRLLPAGILIPAGIALACLLGRELDILSLGEETARMLGLNTGLYRFLFLLIAAALAGAAVSFAGLLGFVGLIVPHSARFLAGSDNSARLLLISALIGATFLMVCDAISRTAFSPYELPVGIFVAFLGAPFFLRLLFRRSGRAAP
jgi:iron complex transport system permease protein